MEVWYKYQHMISKVEFVPTDNQEEWFSNRLCIHCGQEKKYGKWP
jgi:hypothetical protein